MSPRRKKTIDTIIQNGEGGFKFEKNDGTIEMRPGDIVSSLKFLDYKTTSHGLRYNARRHDANVNIELEVELNELLEADLSQEGGPKYPQLLLLPLKLFPIPIPSCLYDDSYYNIDLKIESFVKFVEYLNYSYGFNPSTHNDKIEHLSFIIDDSAIKTGLDFVSVMYMMRCINLPHCIYQVILKYSREFFSITNEEEFNMLVDMGIICKIGPSESSTRFFKNLKNQILEAYGGLIDGIEEQMTTLFCDIEKIF